MDKENTGSFFGCVIKGVATALIITLLSVLLFAIIVKTAYLSQGVIKAVNQFIKILSVFLGCAFSLKGSKGLIKGVLVGLIFTVLTYLIFALLGSGISFGLPFIIDLIMGIVVGGVSGIISVNLKRN